MESSNGGGFYRLPLCSHLLQQSLRSFCTDSQWLYAVYWRILPRNFPPPKWEMGGYLDRTKANKRNWILVWEDGFCDFARATASAGLQPDLFFKMSHEVYNYGEGLMGKISAENGHKWVHKDPSQADSTPSWQNAIDPQPRTWEPQFKAGIQTISVIAVREGLVQLGSTQKISEDASFVALLQRKFNSLLVNLSTSAPESPLGMSRDSKMEGDHQERQAVQRNLERQMSWNGATVINPTCQQAPKGSNHMNSHATFMPSMTSLEALLSKLPSVTSPSSTHITHITKLPSVTSPSSTQITHITNSNGSSQNVDLSYPYNVSPLIRSLSAPHGDMMWLQEPGSTGHMTPNVPMHPAAAAVSENQSLRHQFHQSANLGQHSCFMALETNNNVDEEEYSFMGDLMGG